MWSFLRDDEDVTQPAVEMTQAVGTNGSGSELGRPQASAPESASSLGTVLDGAEQWVDQLVEAIQIDLCRSGVRQAREAIVRTACSGTDAPTLGLKAVDSLLCTYTLCRIVDHGLLPGLVDWVRQGGFRICG
jgi:hypothetical protein